MTHFAKVEAGRVTEVIVAEADVINSGLFGSPGVWVQTSYNTRGGVHYGDDGQPDGGIPLRKNFAGIGYIYDPIREAFIPPRPFQSWKLNETSCLWEAPVEYPTDGNLYSWNENSLSWEPQPLEA